MLNMNFNLWFCNVPTRIEISNRNAGSGAPTAAARLPIRKPILFGYLDPVQPMKPRTLSANLSFIFLETFF